MQIQSCQEPWKTMVVCIASNTDKNGGPSLSGAIGGHSFLANLIWFASALSLCIQASKYMYMMFRYQPLSLYHQITTALTMQICSTYYMCNQPNTRLTASDSVHSHTRWRYELYVVLPQRVGAHAWKYIHACHSNLQNMLHSTSQFFDQQIAAQSAITIHIHHHIFQQTDQTFLLSCTVCRGHINWQTVHTHTNTQHNKVMSTSS